jgi:hypothetical protein
MFCSGKFQVAEFAADLWQVYRGEAKGEYGEPTEFFARTYLTEGLKQLLKMGMERLSGTGGDPVVELQTISAAVKLTRCWLFITFSAALFRQSFLAWMP